MPWDRVARTGRGHKMGSFVGAVLLGAAVLSGQGGFVPAAAAAAAAPVAAAGAPVTFNVRSAGSGPWSAAQTWEGGRAPGRGDFVQVRAGHAVTYDVDSDVPIRMVHVAGTLTFARDRDTRLDVGLLKVQRGEDDVVEDGFACAAHALVEQPDDSRGPLPVLEIGTPAEPIPAGVTATIRLLHFDGTNAETLPAIVNCGGRWDVHGAPMSRTWVKLAQPAAAGADTLMLTEGVSGWRAGDRVIVTDSEKPRHRGSGYDRVDGDYGSEMRLLAPSPDAPANGSALTTLKLDKPLARPHAASDEGRVEVANLSRNVVIESAEPKGVRGHTMYHRHSTGGISYAEFRHLGKEGLLGKYPIHFHLVRDAMRGSGVVGASIWDSKNRFMAIHGTDYLLVRDCVGFRSVGHGFFLEDATEQYNVLDRNLAVQCFKGKRLPDQVLPFDQNEGAGFWWANGRNTLVRNVACENDRYGYRFEIARIGDDDPVIALRTPDGSVKDRDVRTVPFLRFEDNESHSEGLYSFFFGDDPNASVRGDRAHPFVARNLRAWQTHYALRPNVQFFLMDRLDVDDAVYGVYHPLYDAHVYRDVRLNRIASEPVNRGHDDESFQTGSFTYDRLTISNSKVGRDPLIQLTCSSPTPGNAGHFRGLSVVDSASPGGNVVDLGGGPRVENVEHGVAYYFHDSPGGGRALKVVNAHAPDATTDGGDYKPVEGFTGKDVRAAEVAAVPFPTLLEPVDDLPPATMITSVRRQGGRVRVTGVSQDDGEVAAVTVNGQGATISHNAAGVADWEIELDEAAGGAAAGAIEAGARDQAGNVELTPAVRPLAP
jgi:hypothetical protein